MTSEPARGVTAPAGTTKARIERAAVGLFAARGYDAVTTREIAAASDISEGALYRHYNSKAALAQTLYDTMEARLADAFAQEGERNADVMDAMGSIATAVVEIAQDDPALFAFHNTICQNGRRFPFGSSGDDAEKPAKPIALLLQSRLENASERQKLSNNEAQLKTQMIYGAMMQIIMTQIRQGRAAELTNLAPHIAKAMAAVVQTA